MDEKYLFEYSEETAIVRQIWRLREDQQDPNSLVISAHYANTMFLWSDVRLISEYGYDEDWKQYSDKPKVNVHLINIGAILVLGDFQEFTRLWKQKLELMRKKLFLRGSN